jgi:hypothetical protein
MDKLLLKNDIYFTKQEIDILSESCGKKSNIYITDKFLYCTECRLIISRIEWSYHLKSCMHNRNKFFIIADF